MSSAVGERKEEIKEYFAGEEDIMAAYLFGSHGTEYETPLSDIDFAVLYRGGEESGLMRDMQVMAGLSSILRIEDIDLVNLNKAPILLQHEIISSGELLYERDRETVSDFIYHVLTFAYDEKIRVRKYYDELEKALRGEYLNE